MEYAIETFNEQNLGRISITARKPSEMSEIEIIKDIDKLDGQCVSKTHYKDSMGAYREDIKIGCVTIKINNY
jgi:hypothetical protein